MTERIDEARLRVPKEGMMNVDGIIYANEELEKNLEENPTAVEQIKNVASLPGIIGHSLGLPDIHPGYGFTIGGVAAFDLENGVVSPGGVGYDINCGVRLARTGLSFEKAKDRIKTLVDQLYRDIPCGVGSQNSEQLSRSQIDEIALTGAAWVSDEDTDRIEDGGCLPGADPSLISKKAYSRGNNQLGTLGSGNHFLEVQVIDEVFDEDLASKWGLRLGDITIMIHSGSRGLGHQVCDEYLHMMGKRAEEKRLYLPDPELVYSMLGSPEAFEYHRAMKAAANYAYANRHKMHMLSKAAFQKVMKGIPGQEFQLVYDVCHNIAKLESFGEAGEADALVHRKGATRAWPKGHWGLPEIFKDTGQPAIVPGDMGTASYVLVGTWKAMKDTFGSICHGAGRAMGRNEAIRKLVGQDTGKVNAEKVREGTKKIQEQLDKLGIYVRYNGAKTLVEEYSDSYKDIDQVVATITTAGLASRVVRLRPIGVVKG